MSDCIPRLAASHSPVFLLNSCLDLFSAPPDVTPKDPFSRSYGVNLPSSLTVSLSSASVLSHPTTCVGFRYGPAKAHATVADFLGSMLLGHYPSARRPPVLSGLANAVASGIFRLPPFNALFGQRADLSLLRLRPVLPQPGCGILTACPSVCPPRDDVRPRLTLNRLALFRNPWSSGEGVSRPLYRYLCLHLLFRNLQQPSRIAFSEYRNAPLPIYHYNISHVFGTGLMPDYYPRGAARLVSCYALFK